MTHLLAATVSLVPFLVPSSSSEESPGDVGRPEGEIGLLAIEFKQVLVSQRGEFEVEAGTLLVPERRDVPGSPPISIPFYRVASYSSEPAAPIFLLAGGPGSSWINMFSESGNFDDVQRFAEYADVVLFDQRGAGHSKPLLDCAHRETMALDEPFEVDAWSKKMCAMSAQCRADWQARGVDLAGYTRIESAADVDALRHALGYETISLFGGSYGSHLALAVMKLYPRSIERAVLFGIEGLDHTHDDPSGRLATLQRIATHAEASSTLRPAIPNIGLLACLAKVIEPLETKPVLFTNGAQEVVIDASLVRLLASYQAGKQRKLNLWPEFILDLYAEDYSFVSGGAMALRRLRLQSRMHFMMDCSSGIIPERAKRYADSPATRVLGDINMDYKQTCPAWNAPDLGAAFRGPLKSSIPTLLVHGTWGMHTAIENARELLKGLEHGHLIEVIGGTHGATYDLYKHWEPAEASSRAKAPQRRGRASYAMPGWAMLRRAAKVRDDPPGSHGVPFHESGS